jgi:AcrR family transcriptional regulator
VQVPSRRERLRVELTAAIKATALRQLAQDGPQAVTLRGIARDLEISPAAIYGYFASLDDLYENLIADGFHAQAERVEEAIARHRDHGAADQLLAGLLAYRVWAIEHPELFRLLYFSPIPGYVAPEDGPTVDAALRVSAAFLAVLVDAWATGLGDQVTPGPQVDTTKFADRFGLHVTPDQLRTAVGCWGQFHGLVCLEVGGHVTPEWTDPAALYEASMRAMVLRAGLPEPSAAITTASVAAAVTAASRAGSAGVGAAEGHTAGGDGQP